MKKLISMTLLTMGMTFGLANISQAEINNGMQAQQPTNGDAVVLRDGGRDGRDDGRDGGCFFFFIGC